MSVTLRKRKNSDGTTSLFLAIWHDGRRSYEFLNDLKLNKATNPLEATTNKEKLGLANAVRAKRELEYGASEYSLQTGVGLKTTALVWMEAYVKKYDKGDKRNMEGVLERFKTFLGKEKKSGITFKQISEDLVIDFRDNLIATCKYSGSTSYFARFKKMMRAASKQLKISNPAIDVKNTESDAEERDILSSAEISLLAKTPIQSEAVRKAFLFSCATGIAWCDIKALIWRSIDLEKRLMTYSRKKTSVKVTVPLNDAAIKIVGARTKANDLVFDLPSADGANKTIKAWVERAEIDKKITWHNARHSFGTNTKGDIYTKSLLLGHKGLSQTKRYVRPDEVLSQLATDSVNFEF